MTGIWRWLRLLPLLLGCAVGSWAQTFDLQKGREPVTSLAGSWRFHPGESPRANGTRAPLWASPGFDDAQWPLLRSDEGWNQQGYPRLTGIGWYRFQIIAPPEASSFLIALPEIESSYQLFADGRLIGQVGGLPPQAARVVTARRLFTVPLSPAAGSRRVELALRVWMSPAVALQGSGGPAGAAYAGAPAMMRRWFANEKRTDLFRLLASYTLYIVEVLVGLASLLLYLLRRQETAYLWFAIACLLPDNFIPWLALAHFASPLLTASVAVGLITVAEIVTSALFYLTFVRGDVRRWLPFFVVTAVMLSCSTLTVFSGVAFAPITWAGGVLYSAGAVVLLGRAARARKPEAKLLFWTVLIFQALAVLSYTDWVGHTLGLTAVRSFNLAGAFVAFEAFAINFDDIASLLWYLGIASVLIYRFARISREEERHATSLDEARRVQQRLVPASIPTVAGVHAEAVYRAAEEVGGDFYQVFPEPGAASLIVVGDVSGKGLQAAMVGTLAVGALRTLAREQLTPAELLTRLNREICGATDGGFITCLCARLSADGALTVANAGHLAPYVDGEELPCPADLPLGIVPDLEYEECGFRLPAGARITFVSDGVVEARGKDGELFGFDRARNVSRLSAHEIADAAQRFGQQDDITVLTLDWKGAAVAAGP